MEYFLRSLKYLKPYRKRLSVAVACVVLIAVLWGGGLAMLMPAMKILIGDEGFHGWAWNTMAQDRLGARIVQQRIPAGTRVDGQPIALVLSVVDVEKDSPAHEAGIHPGDWLVGIGDDPNFDVQRADVLGRTIGTYSQGGTVNLRVYTPGKRSEDDTYAPGYTATVQLGEVGFKGEILGWMATQTEEPQTRAGRFPLLLVVLGIGIGMTILRDILRFTQEYLVDTAVWQGIMDLRCDNYNVVLHLPTTFFSEKGVTDTMSRFVQDTNELANGQTTLFGKTLVEPAKAIASIVLALILSWQLTLLAMVAGPPAYFLIRKFGKVMKRASRRALESWSAMLAVLEETLTGIRVVKAYTMESAERKRFRQVNQGLVKQQRRMSRINAATAPAVEALGITAAMGAVAIAGYWVLHDQLDSEIFIALMACLAAMFDPVRKLAKVSTRFQRSDAAAKRVFELTDTPQEHRVRNAPTLPVHSESIRFQDVTYRYPSAGDDALKDIDLEITYGQRVAIVGPNGCGKTTLVSLLPRLIDPQHGRILIDGRDVAEHSVRSLRRQIGLVTQDTVLFNATIAENIAYGLRRPSSEKVLDAAKRAFVDEFVRQMPDGYETMVGQHGATLSGGQKQRLAIARAILRNPAILIFDEATSQVDADSERRIHQAMEQFMADRTTLMIAHRFQTIMSSDLIVVMNAGRIEATGNHEDLLGTNELYRHLYKTQFVDADV
ncbi:MAG: ABC transporter transmembrane domain-containing protein [Phycisphaerae bacterium]